MVVGGGGDAALIGLTGRNMAWVCNYYHHYHRHCCHHDNHHIYHHHQCHHHNHHHHQNHHQKISRPLADFWGL